MKYFLIILLAAFAITFIYCIYLKGELQLSEYKNEELQGQIKALQNDAEKAKAKYDAAAKQADADNTKWQKKANGIMKSKVPTDCEKAMQWAIDRARVNGL